MLTDWSSIAAAERKAFNMLICPVMTAPPGTDPTKPDWAGNAVMTGAQVAAAYPGFSDLVVDDDALYISNQFLTESRLITAPSILTQELPLIISSTYKFSFAANASPDAGYAANDGPYLNNVVLAKNNVAAIYGIRLRIGYGDFDGVQRVYQTYGSIPGDNFIYNGLLSNKAESESQIDQFNGDDFKELPQGNVAAIQKYDGCMLINPIRLYSGQLGKLKFTWEAFNDALTGLTTISDNAVVQLSLFVVSGQASAGA